MKNRGAIVHLVALAALLLAGSISGRSYAQVSVSRAAPRFEVASIKQNKIGAGKKPGGATTAAGTGAVAVQRGSLFRARNVTVQSLILFAHGSDGDPATPIALEEQRVVGGPAWIRRDAFDVDAKMPDGPRAPGDPALMVRALLAERFAMKAHQETRERPAYALVRARRDGTLGQRLRARFEKCLPDSAGPEPVRCGVRFRPGLVSGNEVTMPGLALTLSRLVDRVVIDRTGLAGIFDFEVRFTPGGEAQPFPPSTPGNEADTASIFTALQEQLGLKLEPTRAPMEVLVIDSVRRPSEN